MQELARYEADDGTEVVLTDVDICKVITDNPNVTKKEMKMFVELCKAQKLNPFIREAYLIKYGDKPATIVVGKDVFTKRAFRNPRFRGLNAGVTVINRDGCIERRKGSMHGQATEKLIGGWCEVFVDGYNVPMYSEVSFDEYAGKKKDGSYNAQWSSKPGTMIRKVAMVQALRDAFPEEFQGMYDEAEMGVSSAQIVDDDDIPNNPSGLDETGAYIEDNEVSEPVYDEVPPEMYAEPIEAEVMEVF